MAYVSTSPVSSESAGPGAIRRFFNAIIDGMVAMGEADPRFRKLNALAAMTDEELARRGLRRDQIAREVLGSTFYI